MGTIVTHNGQRRGYARPVRSGRLLAAVLVALTMLVLVWFGSLAFRYYRGLVLYPSGKAPTPGGFTLSATGWAHLPDGALVHVELLSANGSEHQSVTRVATQVFGSGFRASLSVPQGRARSAEYRLRATFNVHEQAKRIRVEFREMFASEWQRRRREILVAEDRVELP